MNLDSPLKELKLYHYQVEISSPVSKVIAHFKNHPNLPGVILTKNKKFYGLISQKRFWQYMSRPYSLELSQNRNLDYIYDFLKLESLILSKNTKIVEAVEKILERPPGLLQEPIAIEISLQEYKMIDVHQVLIAQAEIHELANLMISNLYKDMERLNQKLQLLSNLDGLTNLANRRKFDEYLEEKWLEVLHNRSCMSLIICDIDRFREYNDIYGSLAGDDCLRKISEAIEKSSEQLSCLAARYGADKLAIVLPKKDAINAAALTEQIARQVKSLEIEHSGSDVSNYVTMSFGIASMLASGSNKSEMLLIAADRALYQAKRTGRNRKVIWNNSYLKTTMKQS